MSDQPFSAVTEILALERKATVLTALQSRVGAAKGIHEAELVAITMLNGRLCRKAIELLRLDGVRICAHPATGYFIAETDQELKESTDFLIGRAKKSLRQASCMLKVGMPALFDQLNLPD